MNNSTYKTTAEVMQKLTDIMNHAGTCAEAQCEEPHFSAFLYIEQELRKVIAAMPRQVTMEEAVTIALKNFWDSRNVRRANDLEDSVAEDLRHALNALRDAGVLNVVEG